MITDEIENLIHSIDHKTQLLQNVNQRTGFRTRLEELEKHLEELDQNTAVVKAFVNRNFPRPDVVAKASAVKGQVNTILEGYRESPASIISLNNVVLKNTLKSLNAALEQYISESWRAYTDRAHHINQQVLEGLGSIPLFARIVQQVRILNIQIENCRRNLPASEADFEKFDRLAADIEAAWNDLGSTDLPTKVELFLRSAGSREGAGLELLTPEVGEWLLHKGIKNSFRIHMKSVA